jgi:hypothetical protein
MYFSEDCGLIDRLMDHQESVAALWIDLQATSIEDKRFLEICDKLTSQLCLAPVSNSEAQCASHHSMESERLRTFVSGVVPSES